MSNYSSISSSVLFFQYRQHHAMLSSKQVIPQRMILVCIEGRNKREIPYPISAAALPIILLLLSYISRASSFHIFVRNVMMHFPTKMDIRLVYIIHEIANIHILYLTNTRYIAIENAATLSATARCANHLTDNMRNLPCHIMPTINADKEQIIASIAKN